jgi:hypothetical protein
MSTGLQDFDLGKKILHISCLYIIKYMKYQVPVNAYSLRVDKNVNVQHMFKR